MSGKNHLKFALFCTALFYLPAPNNHFEFIPATLIGSLLPDIDHKNSIAGAIVPAWLVFKHAKQTHTLIALFIIITLHLIFRQDFFYGLWIGYATHLLADELDGAPLKYLFFPFKNK